MGVLRSVFGKVQWTQPKWLQQLGLKKLMTGIGLAIVLSILAVAVARYYDSLPKPTRVVAEVRIPGITPIVDDELMPLPVAIDFFVKADPRTPIRTVESVARIELIYEEIADGVSIEPAIAGTWRWDDENTLVFQPSVDWPAGQEYTVNYDESLFSPDLTLASERVKFVTQEFRWDGTDSRGAAGASGVYLIQATDGSTTQLKKGALVK